MPWCRRIRERVVSRVRRNFVHPRFGERSNQDCVLAHAQSRERGSAFVSVVILCANLSG